MTTLHVIICGTDPFRVESALHASVENTHFAWNKKYTFSCTAALSVSNVEPSLLHITHAIVLGEGARLPKSRDDYGGKPIVSLEKCPPNVVENVRDSAFYYGECAMEDLPQRLLRAALTPLHVVWDSLLATMTREGTAAYQRAFWLLDKDADGYLNADEMIAWRRLVDSASFDAAQLTAFLEEWRNPEVLRARRCSVRQFIALHAAWLQEAAEGDDGGAEKPRLADAWATLYTAGTNPDGLPYTWYDLHSMRVDRDRNTYLSAHGIQFFMNLYKLKRFGSVEDSMWAVTPGCPWEGINGFLKERIPLDNFIEYWKYMALMQRAEVCKYARYWGYKGETSFLFVRRNTRLTREDGEALPNTIQVLTAGSPRCGRRSLLFALTASDDEPYGHPAADERPYVRTTTFFAKKAGRESMEEPQTIIYTALSHAETSVVLANETLNKAFDVILLCYDASDISRSGRYLMDTYTQIKEVGGCGRMPVVVAMTKSDVPSNDPHALHSAVKLEQFCRRHQLLWPPILTSYVHREESEIVALTEYMYAVAVDPDIAVGSPPLTVVRLLRRGTFFAIAGVLGYGLLSTLAGALRRRSSSR